MPAMTTLHLTAICPPVASKLFWIKFNRLLAWSLLASPIVYWATGTKFEAGLFIDFWIMVAHGFLSYALFGAPLAKDRKFRPEMHVLGFRPRSLSERNRFLLSGHRIVAAVLAMTLMALTSGMVAWAIFILFLYPLLRLSITVIQHIYLGVLYASRRWKFGSHADEFAMFVVVMFLCLSIFNMVC
jgi:hypothetical protein